MIVASIRASAALSVLKEIVKAKSLGADAVELRLDYIKKPNLSLLLKKKVLPVIITARPKWEGGSFAGTEEERIAILREAVRLGADYIDLEFKAYKDFNRGKSKLILSYHDFYRIPDNLNLIMRKMQCLKPDILKIAVKANCIKDVIKMEELQHSAKQPSAIFSMGEFGLPSRILYKRLGSALTYCALSPDKKTAEGQPLLEDLVNVYAAKNITHKTKIYALIGNPVSHSKGPFFFNRVFKLAKRDARYILIRVDDITAIKEIISTFCLAGLSVTIPHKSAIIKYLDTVDSSAKEIGAVNTVQIKAGKLIGYNTDSPAAVECVREGVKRKFGGTLKGKSVLLLGAGGAAKSVAFGLAKEGAKIIIANRTYKNAKVLADAVGGRAIRLTQLGKVVFDVVVNSTSVGMHPNVESSPLEKKYFTKDMVAFDCVYTPQETKFLALAKSKGAEIVYGTKMFLLQAILQYKIFTDRVLRKSF